MAVQQTQAYCNLCQRPTLHTRHTEEVPHLFHLFVTVLLGLLSACFFGVFGFVWLGVWFLHTLLVMAGGQDSFRCTQCGQVFGEMTPQQAAIQQQQLAAVREHHAQRRAAWFAACLEAMQARAQSTAAFLSGIPGHVDDRLRAIAGEGNDIVFHFLRVLILVFVAILIAISVGLLVTWVLPSIR